MVETRLRQTIEKVLRHEPRLYADHKRGKAVEGRIVGLVLEDMQGGFSPLDVHAAVVEVLAVCDPPIITDREKLALVVLPANKPKAVWKIYENVPHDLRLNLRRWGDTDIADKYRSDQGLPLEEEGSTGLLVMRVLPVLDGREWNNAAFNVVRSLRPSSLRVTSGVMTVDRKSWRVTVLLEANNRTIKYIEQEVEVGLIGCRYSSDVDSYLTKELPPYEPCPGVGMFNPRGIAR